MISFLRGFTALCVAFAAGVAHGGIIAVDFEGAIEQITTFGVPGNAQLDTRYSAGDLVSGRLTYSTDATNTVSLGATSLMYLDSLLSMSINIDGEVYSATGGRVRVSDNDFNRDFVIFEGNEGLTGPVIGGAPNRLQFSVGSTDRTKLASLALPNAVELNSLEDIWQGNLNFVAADGGGAVRFDIASFVAQTVPEPTAFATWSILSGIGFIGQRRRRKRCTSSPSA